MSEEIVLHGGDVEWNVELSEPGVAEKFVISSTHPQNFGGDVTEEQAQWLVQLINFVSDIEMNNINQLSQFGDSELMYLIQSCVAVFDETETEVQSRDDFFGDDRQTLIDEDGNVSKLYE